ncbi:MAG TPA: M1 family aminopeptidase [Pyrinomonadaceae bacterium]|nr:M1 family aminopeptidase [Pyrinomonadaceae bacterium]
MRQFIKQATRIRFGFLLAALLCLAASVAPAQEVAPRAAHGAPASPRTAQEKPAHEKLAQEKLAATPTFYQINFTLDFDARTFTATERVRWVNRDTRPASAVYFHLYANLRSPSHAVNGGDAPRAAPAAGDKETSAVATDEPRIEIKSVRHAATQSPLIYALDEQATLLRVNLREPVAAGATTDIEIAFAGAVPEIDPDETSLPSHVIQQLGAALRDTRETRRARDTNFRARGVMVLGAAYPVLAVRDGDVWQREVRPTVGDPLHTEVADYEVTIDAPTDVALYTSAEPATTTSNTITNTANTGAGVNAANAGAATNTVNAASRNARTFAGKNLRNFAILAGRGLHSAERIVGAMRVRSVWTTEHEKIGRRVLDTAAEAVRVFTARYGALPVPSVTVAEAPLVAGLGSAEFANLSIIASAFYLDFDSAAVRNLPELVREQRASVEDSLEFATAHMLAHQWWGMLVGNSPERTPVLDEALAHWSALVYYRETHGAARAQAARDDQLRGVYEIYRTFGGEDMPALRPARDYRNSFQYAAIVSAKGALMYDALVKLLGEERVFTALRRYAEANRYEIAELDDLRGAFAAEAPVAERRAVTRTFDRWLSERRGDEDVAPPNPQLAAALGLTLEPAGANNRNAFSRLGRFFWRQMTRIR